MYLKCHTRRKDGKEHRYWSLMEERRVADGRILDRPLLYLGEINDAQQAAWTGTIAAFDSGTTRTHGSDLWRFIPDGGRLR